MGRPRTTFEVNCQPSHGPNEARGLCRSCYNKQRRIDILNARDGGYEREKRLTRYEEWLDYQSCGYSMSFVANKMGIKLTSLERTIQRGRTGEQL